MPLNITLQTASLISGFHYRVILLQHSQISSHGCEIMIFLLGPWLIEFTL